MLYFISMIILYYILSMNLSKCNFGSDFFPVLIECDKYSYTFRKTPRIPSPSCSSRTRCCPVVCGAPRASMFSSGRPSHSCGRHRKRLRTPIYLSIYLSARRARTGVPAILTDSFRFRRTFFRRRLSRIVRRTRLRGLDKRESGRV